MAPATATDGRSRNLILTAMIVAAVGLSVFGFQQSSIWGWGNPAIAACIAARIAQSQGGASTVAAIPDFVRFDFAHASQTVFLVMAGIMATAALTALTGLRQGRQQEVGEARVVPESGAPQQEIPSRP